MAPPVVAGAGLAAPGAPFFPAGIAAFPPAPPAPPSLAPNIGHAHTFAPAPVLPEAGLPSTDATWLFPVAAASFPSAPAAAATVDLRNVSFAPLFARIPMLDAPGVVAAFAVTSTSYRPTTPFSTVNPVLASGAIFALPPALAKSHVTPE